jgi:hypothetical protein
MLGLMFPNPPPAGRRYKSDGSPLSKSMTNADVKYIMLDQADDSPFLIRIFKVLGRWKRKTIRENS